MLVPRKTNCCSVARRLCATAFPSVAALSACGRFRRNGTPAPGLAASASVAHRASARFAARTLCSADILGVYIYAVGGESCRIRARPEAVRSAGGGEIVRAWRVLALGPAGRALIALSGRAPRLLPRHPLPIRVAVRRRGIPLLAPLAPRRACREPESRRRPAIALRPRPPAPTRGKVAFAVRSVCARPPPGGLA